MKENYKRIRREIRQQLNDAKRDLACGLFDEMEMFTRFVAFNHRLTELLNQLHEEILSKQDQT
jgi:hypothetical protein